MGETKPDHHRHTSRFPRPVAFWAGTAACVLGVALHLPMYFSASDVHYRLDGMRPDAPMIVGMISIVAGIALSLCGLLPRRARAIRDQAAGIRVRALDDASISFQHVALLFIMALAVTIDVMKPTTLSFVAPGVAREYGLKTAANPGGSIPVTWLPLAGIAGTVVGSLVWGWFGDRIGRRASILFAGIVFISTSICGTMPSFGLNLVMCFIMGLGAGGMLPIAFALIAEIIPARHRGWLIVLIGGDIAGAYVITSWLAGALTPEFGWRILWLIGMPTGLLLILLNHWIPESPRYLLAAGRGREAEAVMRRYGASVVARPQSGPAAADGVRDGFSTLFSRQLVGPTLTVVGLAVSVGLLTYGFQFWVPTNLQHLGLAEVTSDYVLRNSALLGLPLTVVVALLYGFWSSKKTIIVLSALTGLAVLIFAICVRSLAHDTILLSALLVIPLTGISSVAAVLTAYGSEIYPTMVRSRGAGLVAGMTKAGGVVVLGLVLAVTATPSLLVTSLIGAVPLLLAVVAFVIAGRDTHQRRLEEISAEEVTAPSPPG